jgi:hypothetical protein
MNNQPSTNGGVSPELQPMIDPAPNDSSGQAPPAVSLESAPLPADIAGQSGAPGPMAPDSAKGGHV